MIQAETILDVADNSGAKKVQCIKVLKGAKSASIGNIIIVAVKEATPNGKVKKGQVCKAVIVRTRSSLNRKDGTVVYFDQNAVVLVDNKGEPIGTRVFGTVTRELRALSFTKIMSLAPEVI